QRPAVSALVKVLTNFVLLSSACAIDRDGLRDRIRVALQLGGGLLPGSLLLGRGALCGSARRTGSGGIEPDGRAGERHRNPPLLPLSELRAGRTRRLSAHTRALKGTERRRVYYAVARPVWSTRRGLGRQVQAS